MKQREKNWIQKNLMEMFTEHSMAIIKVMFGNVRKATDQECY